MSGGFVAVLIGMIRKWVELQSQIGQQQQDDQVPVQDQVTVTVVPVSVPVVNTKAKEVIQRRDVVVGPVVTAGAVTPGVAETTTTTTNFRSSEEGVNTIVPRPLPLGVPSEVDADDSAPSPHSETTAAIVTAAPAPTLTPTIFQTETQTQTATPSIFLPPGGRELGLDDEEEGEGEEEEDDGIIIDWVGVGDLKDSPDVLLPIDANPIPVPVPVPVARVLTMPGADSEEEKFSFDSEEKVKFVVPEGIDEKSLKFMLESGIEREKAILALRRCKSNAQMAMESIFQAEREDSISSQHQDIVVRLQVAPQAFALPPASASADAWIPPEMESKESQSGSKRSRDLQEFSASDTSQLRLEHYKNLLYLPPKVDLEGKFLEVPPQSQHQPPPGTVPAPAAVPVVRSGDSAKVDDTLLQFLVEAGADRVEASIILTQTENDGPRASAILFDETRKREALERAREANAIAPSQPRAAPAPAAQPRHNRLAQSMYLPTQVPPMPASGRTQQPSVMAPGLAQTVYGGPGSRQTLRPSAVAPSPRPASARLAPLAEPARRAPVQPQSQPEAAQSGDLGVSILLNRAFVLVCPLGGYVALHENRVMPGTPLVVSNMFMQQWVLSPSGHIVCVSNQNLVLGFAGESRHGSRLVIIQKSESPDQLWQVKPEPEQRYAVGVWVVLSSLMNERLLVAMNQGAVVLQNSFRQAGKVDQTWFIQYV